MSSLEPSCYEYIKSMLVDFGLEDFDLSKGEFKKQFIKLKLLGKLPRVFKDRNKYIFSHGDNKNYTFKSVLGNGSYNSIEQYYYRKTNVRNPIYVIMRISETTASKRNEFTTETDITNALYSAFIDCLKTIILNIFTNKYVGEKITPDIYNFGYCYETEEFIMCMETINVRSDFYINSHFLSDKIQTINSFIINIYRKLELLNTFGLQFRHGDLKYNNVLVHNNSPIFIDFGFTSFKIPGTSIYFESHSIDDNNILNFHKYFEDDKYDPVKSDKYNIIQDLFLFMTSIYCMSCFPTEYELSLLMKSANPAINFIIEGFYLYEYLNKKYKIKSRDDFIKRQITFKIYYDNMSSINIVRDLTNGYIDFKINTLFTYDDLLKNIDNDLPKPVVPDESVLIDDTKLLLSDSSFIETKSVEPKSITDLLPITEMEILLRTIEDVTNSISNVSNTVCSCEFVEAKKSCKHFIHLSDNPDKLKKYKSDDLTVD